MSRHVQKAEKIDDDRYTQARLRWMSPFVYQDCHAGKKVRTELTHALAAFYGIGKQRAGLLCEVVEHFNTASLIHDDIADADEMRRGAPSVWVQFSVGHALMSGMYGYVHGLQILATLKRVDLIEVALRSLEELHVGQSLDLHISDGMALPALKQYRLIAELNTGCFFDFILNACQKLKPLPEGTYLELKALMRELAVYYRYVNDYCDINHRPHFDKKGFATDLDEGPKSFVMILAGLALPKKKRTDREKREYIRELGHAGIFDKAQATIGASYKQLCHHLDRVRFLSPKRSAGSLQAFLRSICFEQKMVDNYYEYLCKHAPLSDPDALKSESGRPDSEARPGDRRCAVPK